MPTLSSLVALECAVVTTFGATSDDKVGIFFQCHRYISLYTALKQKCLVDEVFVTGYIRSYQLFIDFLIQSYVKKKLSTWQHFCLSEYMPLILHRVCAFLVFLVWFGCDWVRSHHSHYNDFIMSVMASQIPSYLIVNLSACSGTDKRKHQSSTSLGFVWWIHRWTVNSPHKGPVTQKMFPFDDVIMTFNSLPMGQSCNCASTSAVTLNDMGKWSTIICIEHGCKHKK